MGILFKKALRYSYQLSFFLFVLAVVSISAKTRWSSLHLVPDADFYATGEFTLGFNGFLSKDTSDKIQFKPTVPLRFGITEWINFDIAYAGGVSIGLKARILGETHKAMPSLAIGVHNLIKHKEVNYFSVDSAKDMSGELFLVMSKGVDAIKTRFHLGIQSIPTNKKDQINPFFAVEKYFGADLYAAFECYQRQHAFNLSLFANWRFLKRHFEVSAGAVDIRSMFFDKDNNFAVSLAPLKASRFVKPGIMVGLTFHGSFGIGSSKGFMSVEDRMRKQDETIDVLVGQVDSLTVRLRESMQAVASVQKTMDVVIDSVLNDPNRLQNIIFDKLTTLKALYNEEPFDADKVKSLIREIASYHEKAVPSLETFLLDQTVDRYIRMYSAAMLGEIGSSASSDVLLDVLAQTNDPDIKIEILIAIGKLKETRAMYLLEQLANSPNDAIAITAQEVLALIAEQTGADITPGLKIRPVAVDEEKPLKIDSSALSTNRGVKTAKASAGKKTVSGDTAVSSDSTGKSPVHPQTPQAGFTEQDIPIGGKGNADSLAVKPVPQQQPVIAPDTTKAIPVSQPPSQPIVEKQLEKQAPPAEEKGKDEKVKDEKGKKSKKEMKEEKKQEETKKKKEKEDEKGKAKEQRGKERVEADKKW